jgi:hypothetical protein
VAPPGNFSSCGLNDKSFTGHDITDCTPVKLVNKKLPSLAPGSYLMQSINKEFRLKN